MRYLYSLCWYLALPLVLMRLRKRAKKAPAYGKRVPERFGHVTPRNDKPLWIHAVSVGETVAIAPLVKLLLARQPELPIVITTMTPTGAERVQELFGDAVTHHYCPYDLPHAVGRFLKRIQPRALVVVETELWPNVVAGCAGRNIPVLLANARLSARSAKGYAKFSALTRPMLQQISLIAAQNPVDGGRFVELGLPAERLTVTGSVKFDITPPSELEAQAQALKAQWGADRKVLVAGSTHEGEEDRLLAVFSQLRKQIPDLLLVLVPRHPERFAPVKVLAEQQGFDLCCRSSGIAPDTQTQVYLGDTMGDLMMLFGCADLAFVGGSLIERGGHNPLEPACLQKPVLMGQHVFNFAVICEALAEAGGLLLVKDDVELAEKAGALLMDETRAAEMGKQGAAFVKANQGALERLYQQVESVCLNG